MKKYLVWGLLILVLCGLVNAVGYRKFLFYADDAHTIPVTNMQVIGWKCANTDCTAVTTLIPQFTSSGINTGAKNFIIIEYPENNKRYLLLFMHQNYIYKYLATTSSGGLSPDAYAPAFIKKANCKAPSSLTVENKIGEWLPLTIDTTSQLDANTASAISTITNTYYPPDEIFKQYKEVATTVTLQIKDKATGNVVKTASQNLRIYWDTSKTASFTWSKDTDPLTYKAGKYTVILTTHVTDQKCSSVIDDVKSQDIEVFPELPDDACVIKAEPTKLRTAISRGQQGLLDIPAYYYHMKKEYDASYNMHLVYTGITANYKLTFTNKTNKVDKILTGSFPKSFTDVRKDIAPAKPTNTVAWTPLSSGNYNVKLEMTSTDALCTGKLKDFSQGTRTDTVNVLAKDVDLDGYKDDVDCNDNNILIHPGAIDTCGDLIDNDCNGKDGDGTCQCTNGQTSSCSLQGRKGECAKPIVTCVNGQWGVCPTKVSDEVCRDLGNLDEDCDGYPNCEDADCKDLEAEVCSDSANVDEDCDGYANCLDSECIGVQAEVCKDLGNVDEDCDGNSNCADLDCKNIG